MKSFRDELQEIREICGTEQYKKQIVTAREQLQAKPLVLYGAGAEGFEFFNVLSFFGIAPLCFCDKNKSGAEEQSGLAIIPPKKLLSERYCSANILISSSMYKSEIEKDLKALGISPERILPRRLWFRLCISAPGDFHIDKFIRGFHNLFMINAISKMINGQNDKLLSGYERTYNMLSDDKSKRIIVDRIRYCVVEPEIARNSLDEVYFDPELVTLSEAEVFVDCGMFTADTAEEFFEYTGNKYTHYYGFEPDEKNLELARQFLSGRPNVTTVYKGLWSTETSLSFKEGFLNCSMVCEDGKGNISVTSLDKYFSDKPHVPTFMKMDIEGSELEALKGAETIIRKHKPRLAICIYHKPEDIYTLPDIIKSFRGDYKFYLRHYTNCLCDTVLYAI